MVSEQKGPLQAEVSSLQDALARERERVREMWKINCMQLSEFDTTLTAKDEEIANLRERSRSHSHSPSGCDSPRVKWRRRGGTSSETGETAKR